MIKSCEVEKSPLLRSELLACEDHMEVRFLADALTWRPQLYVTSDSARLSAGICEVVGVVVV